VIKIGTKEDIGEIEIRKGDEQALFLNCHGWRIGANDITSTVKRWAILCGIRKRVYPHLFRISGITNMYLRGVGLEDIRQQSRHADLEVILGYIQLIPEAKRNAYEKGMSLGQPQPTIPNPVVEPVQQTTLAPDDFKLFQEFLIWKKQQDNKNSMIYQ